MKTRLQLIKATATVLIIISIAACSKKDTSTPVVSNADAADAATYAMQSNTGGYAQQIGEGANFATSQGYGKTESATGIQSLTCGVPLDTSISFSFNLGAFSASYSHSWHFLLNCNGSAPTSLDFSGNYNGSYNGPVMSSTNSGSRTWNISGLGNNQSIPYTFNGVFTRTGSHVSKVRNHNTFNSAIDITVTNLIVSKGTHHITGGSGTISIVCTVSNGDSSTYNGTVVFNGNDTATLTINGSTYTVNLY